MGWQVFDCESAELASQLLQDICARHGIAPGQLMVHSDNGSPMKGETMLATLQRLGVAPSRSRPSVSNDNPYSESLFRTLKYRPDLPVKAFEDLLQARRWVTELVHWYNDEHRHSAIGFVTPCCLRKECYRAKDCRGCPFTSIPFVPSLWRSNTLLTGYSCSTVSTLALRRLPRTSSLARSERHSPTRR